MCIRDSHSLDQPSYFKPFSDAAGEITFKVLEGEAIVPDAVDVSRMSRTAIMVRCLCKELYSIAVIPFA